MRSTCWPRAQGSGQQEGEPWAGGRIRERGLTNLDHVEGFVGLAAHSIQSHVHGSQGHQGWRICSQVEFYSVPRTILLATIHVQLQLAEAGGGGQSE